MICFKCGNINPSSAKYCRICGTQLAPSEWAVFFNRVKASFSKYCSCSKSSVSGYTLDKFNMISFKPVSTVKIQFFNKFLLVIVCALVTFLMSFENFYAFRSLFREMLGECDYEMLESMIPLLLIPIAIIGIYLILWSYKKFRFSVNADYIESTAFVGNTVRIAKKCKLGLFNTKNNCVLLSSNYDNIEKFDGQHIKLKKNGKCGIYSLTRKSIIIPVVFDSISEFRNSVASASSSGNTIHFDINGNRLR